MADSVTSLASARAVVDNYIPKHERDGTNPLLLALLDHAPTEQGQLNICRRILECEEGANDKHHTAERLKGLADWYKFGLLVPNPRLPDPKASNCFSRSESTDQEGLDNPVVGEDIAVNQRDVKKAALCRDNHRSVLSGLVDEESTLAGLVPDTNDTTFTEAAHITPFSLGNQNGGDDTYRMCSSRKHHDFPEEKVVHFTTTDSKFPLPDPRFIAIHAACAKVLHASGETKKLFYTMKEYEEALALAPDGSSGALDFALKGLAARC